MKSTQDKQADVESPKLKLVDNIIIDKLSTSSIESKYLLNVNNTRFEISSALYKLIKLIDGNRDIDELSKQYSAAIGKKVTGGDILSISENFLKPNGLIQDDNEDSRPKQKKASYLYFQFPLINQKGLSPITLILRHLFNPLIFKLLLSGSILFHLFFYFILSKPAFSISSIDFVDSFFIYFLFFISTLFHELGHSSACKYYGAHHGNIGIGLYLYFPVFYADVSDIWRLPRRQRIVVDLAGVYFQIVLNIFLFLFFTITQNEVFLYSIYLVSASLIFNFNPFLKFDGYWMLSDFLGIPNLRERSTELFPYLIKKLKKSSDNNPIPYILRINKKEKIIAIPYIFVTNIFFFFIIYRIVFLLPHILMSYPQFLTNTFTAVIKYISVSEWKMVWTAISQFLPRTLILVMLLFMLYRFSRRAIDSLSKSTFFTKLISQFHAFLHI